MKIKIKTRELARKLTNNKLKEIYGDEAVFEDNYDEFYGRKYRKGVMDDARKYFDYYFNEIRDKIAYPFKEGDTYYMIRKMKDDYNRDKLEVIESVWDDVSEQLYMEKPDEKLFNNKASAYIHLIEMEKQKEK